MQGSCSSCGNRITIDDAKVPDRPFQVKCPKCQNLVRFPGKAAAAAQAPSPAAPAPAPAEAAAPVEEPEQSAPPPPRRDAVPGEAGRALVALPDKGQAAGASAMLARLGFEVESFDDASEGGGRLLEQGVYDVVVTARLTGQGPRESLYQRIARLPSEPRRELMLVIIGDDFKTGDGTQAWACLADLVVNSRDAGTADTHFRNVSAERMRVYQPFKEARKRLEAAGG